MRREGLDCKAILCWNRNIGAGHEEERGVASRPVSVHQGDSRLSAQLGSRRRHQRRLRVAGKQRAEGETCRDRSAARSSAGLGGGRCIASCAYSTCSSTASETSREAGSAASQPCNPNRDQGRERSCQTAGLPGVEKQPRPPPGRHGPLGCPQGGLNPGAEAGAPNNEALLSDQGVQADLHAHASAQVAHPAACARTISATSGSSRFRVSIRQMVPRLRTIHATPSRDRPSHSAGSMGNGPAPPPVTGAIVTQQLL